MPTLGIGKTTRNMGIELLRCVTMLAIVVIHLINQGGIFGALESKNVYYFIFSPLLLLCLCSVNLYALISGYVETSFKPRRWLVLWLQVVVLSLLMCLIGELLERGSVTHLTWRRAILPVTQKGFWYFTAYTGLYLLLPILRKGLDALSERGLYYVIFAVFFGFSCGTALGYVGGVGDSFALGGGYSAMWLICLYVLGVALRRTGLLARVKTVWLWLTLALSMGLLFLGAAFGVFPLSRTKPYSYLNPLQLLNAVCLLGIFSRMQCRAGLLRRTVGVLAPLTFGVYVIHVHATFFDRLEDAMTFVLQESPLCALGITLGVAVVIYLGCSAVDWLRLQLFRLLRVPKLCEKFEIFAKKRFDWLVGLLTDGKG